MSQWYDAKRVCAVREREGGHVDEECLVDESCVYGCHCRKPFCPWALNRYSFNLMNIATTVRMVHCTHRRFICTYAARCTQRNERTKATESHRDQALESSIRGTTEQRFLPFFVVVIARDIRAYCGTTVSKQCNGVCGRINSTN